MPHPALIEPLRRWDPEQIGGFVLIGRLGAGAMGQVYLGRSAAGRLVAVKTIKVEYAEEPDFRTRFAREVVAARRVSGAFTAPVVAADPEADVPWLATAYVPAPSLSILVRVCGPLSVPAVRWLAAGCAEALESIHGAGLIHRDLKPSNVLVSPDGPRVIDFGVARAVERVQLTLTRGTVGTPAYMAPEQARDTRQATTASDVYSLGATMVLAATGHSPYRGDTVMDVLVQLATGSPDLGDLPAELTGIVTACLERDPRLRPTSAALLACLAADLTAEPDSRELGSGLLSAPALALIAEYRRDPRPEARPAAGADDDTFGSQPAVRLTPAAAGANGAGGSSAGWSGAGGRPARDPDGTHQPRHARPALTGLAAFAAAVILAGAGVAAGMYLAGGRSHPGAGSTGRSPDTTGSSRRPTSPAGTGTPPPPGPPRLAISQPYGDGDTGFVVSGTRWPPGIVLTVRLAGVGISPDHPTADSVGMFNYVINEAHEFFPGRMPPGRYRVVVTGAGLRRVVRFTVNNLIPGQQPPGLPPGQLPPYVPLGW